MRKYFIPFILIFSTIVAFGALVKKNYSVKPNTSITATEKKPVPMCGSSFNGILNIAAIECVADGLWNASTTWSGGIIPNSNDEVVIPANRTVRMLGSCNAKSIVVTGTLTSNIAGAFNLTTNKIQIENGGALQLGTETNRYRGIGSITLAGNVPAQDSKGITVMNGGRLDLHGIEKLSWTQLNSTALAGATSVLLKESVTGNWLIGDTIIIASSDRLQTHTEKRVVTNIVNSRVYFNEPLTYLHYGEQKTYDNGLTGAARKEWTIDMRTEVANLSRNIKIQGDVDSENAGFGGHIMAMAGSTCRVEQVELFRMGQRNKIARYPLHFHLMGDGGAGQYFKNCAVNRSFNRAYVVHGTNNSLVEGNVAYLVDGSAFFLEDGVEKNNILRKNFGTNIFKPIHSPSDVNAFDINTNLLIPLGIVPSDYKEDGIRVTSPAVFWITNPSNIIEDNVAAGSQGVGFWYGIPEAPTGLSRGITSETPRTIPILSFTGNRAHSVFSGLHIDHSHNSDQTALEVAPYTPQANGVMTMVTISDFTCYKMRRAVWHRTEGTQSGAYIKLDNMKFADIEGAEMLVSSWHGFIENSLMVGKTPNSTFTVPEEGSNNFSAISFYDGWNAVKGCHFENFNDPQYGSVFSYFGGAIDRSNDWFENCTFKNVNYYNDDINIRSNQLSGAIRDVNGSVNGVPNSSIVLGHPYLIDNVNFNRIQTQYTGFQSNKEVHVCKIDFDTPTITTPVSMYSEWGDGHPIHGSTWGGANQFAVIPNLNRIYKLRLLDDIAASSVLRLLYGKNNDQLDLIIQGSPVKLLLTSPVTESSNINAVRTSTVNAWYWDTAKKELHIRLFAKNDTNPADEEYNARSVITIKTIDNLPKQAVKVYSLSKRSYNINTNVTGKFVEAEHYDYGGQFEAYLEMGLNAPNPISDISTSQSIGNTYRLGEVADEKADLSYSNNTAIKDIVSGEYFNYTINVPTSGNYKFIANIQARTSATICTLKVDGVAVDTVEFATESGEIKQYLITELKNLNAGQRTITVSFNNVRYFDNFAVINADDDTDGDGMLDYNEIMLCRNTENANDLGINFDLPDEGQSNWVSTSINNFSIANGKVTGISTGLAKFNNSLKYNFKAGLDTVPRITLRMKASANTLVKLFWENEDGGFNGTRSISKNYTGNNTWQEIEFDLTSTGTWIGKTIKSIQIQPTNAANISFEIDWLRSSGYTDCLTNPFIYQLSTNVLPVDLKLFNGKNTTNGVNLTWETASERNNSRFDILRSSDKDNFNIISSVFGKGNSSTFSKYNYLDIQPLAGVNYYKLNQIDFDGKINPSNIITINTGFSDNTLNIYNNENDLKLTINAIKAGKATLQLFDISGRKMIDKNINLENGLNLNTIDISDFIKGVYVVRVIISNQVLSQKFVK